MKTVISLEIPLGFRVEQTRQQMKIWDAEALLLTKKRRKYMKAVRAGDDAVLHSQYILCPHCSSRLSTVDPRFRWEDPTPEQVCSWASMQLALPGCEAGETLQLNSPAELPALLRCPICGEDSHKARQHRLVELTRDRRRILIRSQITGIDEILSLEWAKTGEIRFSLPVYEVLVFNLDRGRVHVRVEDAFGRVLAQRDVTKHPSLLKGGASDKLLDRNKVAQRSVKRLFRQAWGMELPYNSREINLNTLFQMTQFRGYPRDFYACIPYARDSYYIDRSFRAIAGKLRNASRLEGVFEGSALPQVKSLRRILFETPGLFFYLSEIEGLWQAMADINVLCRFLQSGCVFEILSALHMRPGMLDYLRDYCQVRGPAALCDGLEKHWSTVRDKAIDYSCMSPQARQETRKHWQSRQERRSALPVWTYSVPMARPDERIPDCRIDGYDFFWLRTSNAYALAAQGLNNCLDTWEPGNAPVVCIRKKEEYVGAVEISDGKIVQARGFDNSDLERDRRLSHVFEKWRQRYQLEWAEEEDDEDFDDDFPEEDLPF